MAEMPGKARPTHVWPGRLSLCSSWPWVPAAPADTCRRSFWESSCLGSLETCPAGLRQGACGHDGPQGPSPPGASSWSPDSSTPHHKGAWLSFLILKWLLVAYFFKCFLHLLILVCFAALEIGSGVLIAQGESSATQPRPSPHLFIMYVHQRGWTWVKVRGQFVAANCSQFSSAIMLDPGIKLRSSGMVANSPTH